MSHLFFPAIISSLLPRIPLYLVWIAIIIIAIVNWKKHPKVSLFTIIGISGIMLLSIVGTCLSISLPYILQSRGLSTSKIGLYMGIWSVVSSVLDAAFWGMILAAIFGWRKYGAVPPAAPIMPPSIPTPPMQ